ncbi:YehS family protein [Psychroflexus halocasei]|uniref:Uncharacterized conserved protein YehS, DUF1456 family n=1 Tax=Psychroflexus halocasei TaxID=908615 RepID=A0A1H3ZU10_9FLAO|nr:DUF1456 family protein [Psychroflexus halocasei]SEA27246.1 Uncharacterized conserved protein YehS, DUF1456 family [Psychroflexus halocasei]
MTNNDILRRLRYTFDYSDDQMIEMFAQADAEVTRAQISDWMKKEEDEAYVNLSDKNLATFLNGMINKYRGRREGEQPKPEQRLDNNLIFKKLKIALNLKSHDILSLFELAEMPITKNELSSFLRQKKQPQYQQLLDQYLRNFLTGLQLKHRK